MIKKKHTFFPSLSEADATLALCHNVLFVQSHYVMRIDELFAYRGRYGPIKECPVDLLLLHGPTTLSECDLWNPYSKIHESLKAQFDHASM